MVKGIILLFTVLCGLFMSIFSQNLKNSFIEVVLPADTDNSNYFFQVYINNKLWFQSNEVFLHYEKKLRSTKDESLTVIRRSSSRSKDKLGSYQQYQFTLADPATPTDEVFVGTVKLYSNFILFEQSFPRELQNTSFDQADYLVSGFPCFTIEDAHEPAGYAHWVSWYYNTTTVSSADPARRNLLVAPGFRTPVLEAWDSASAVPGGVGGTGVTAVFDEKGETAVVLSAFENPMVMNHLAPSRGLHHYGLMGNVSSIPAQFKVQTILYASNQGITHAMHNWGKTLRTYYNKPDASEARKRDLTLQYLGFTTDNGAYYYYHTDNNETYEETLLHVYNYTQEVGLPYKYVLLDSWWYYKGENGGVSNWTAQPDLFPNGLDYLYRHTGWYFQGHNRYWALDNVYAKSQGGAYEFVEDHKADKPGAVPVDPNFWKDLLRIPSKNWGLIVYEQDWLFNEFYEYVSPMLSDVHLANLWLTQMAEGAKENDLTIQYCMPFIRHLLQSVQYDVVTQARASDDYVVGPYDPTDPNWRIGGQSLLIDSLGMAPSKDGYWSSSYQPNNPYGEDRYEACPRLQAATCVLSAGPVAIADGIGYSDVDLIMKSCMKDGRLLQPSAPATLIDAGFVQGALHNGVGPDGDVWFAPSTISNQIYGSLFVAELASAWEIKPSHVGYHNKEQKFFVHEANMTSATSGFIWSEDTPLKLNACETSDFQVWTVSPVLSNGWTVLGELSKWVPVSPTRLLEVSAIQEGGVKVLLAGVATEEITITFVTPKQTTVSFTCTIPAAAESITLDTTGKCY